MATKLDGKSLAEEHRQRLEREVDRLNDADVQPKLAMLHVGESSATESYINLKQSDCEKVGITGTYHDIDSDSSQAELHELISDLNDDSSVHGIILQEDVPEQIDWRAAVNQITPTKDVEGLHPNNQGLLAIGEPRFVPCPALGIQKLLSAHDVELAGKDTVIINRSAVVGTPLANLLKQKRDDGNATVTICHTRTQDLQKKTRKADIVVVATSTPGFLDESMVTEDTAVVDVSINRRDADNEKGYEVVGDVDYPSVEPKVEYIAPVPGGVGPITRVMLQHNTVEAAKLQVEDV